MKKRGTYLPVLLLGAVLAQGASAQCPGILPTIRWTSVGTQMVFEDLTELYGFSASRTWSFDDGSQSMGPVTYHTYATTGSDTVQLDLVVAGCTYRLRTPVVHGDTNDVCLTAMYPDFEAQQIANNTLSLTNTSQSPGMPMFAAWGHGDGSIALSSASDHTYVLPGLYAVTLNLAGTDPGTLDGCVAGMCRIVPVEGNASTCDTLLFVNATLSALSAPSILLTGTAQPLGSDIEVDQLIWDPGDSTLQYFGSEVVYHSYMFPGAYLACFRVEAHFNSSGAACWALACVSHAQEPLVGVQEAAPAMAAITAWPNPFDTGVEVRNLPPGDFRVWRVLDLSGSETGHSGAFQREHPYLPLPGLSPGCYLLEMHVGEHRHTLRLMKH